MTKMKSVLTMCLTLALILILTVSAIASHTEFKVSLNGNNWGNSLDDLDLSKSNGFNWIVGTDKGSPQDLKFILFEGTKIITSGSIKPGKHQEGSIPIPNPDKKYSLSIYCKPQEPVTRATQPECIGYGKIIPIDTK